MTTTTLDHIRPNDIVPIHHQLSELIRQRIENGEWSPHQQIASEREIEAHYKVSRTTVRQAIDTLVRQGLLYRDRGRGTFVARPKLEYSLSRLTSFSDDMRARGLEPGQRLLSLGYVEPSHRVRAGLELAAGQRVLRIERLRLGNGEPVGIHITFLPVRTEESITAEELDAAGSLYALLASKFNILPEDADETLEAAAAHKSEAELLDVSEGSPLLLIERITWSRTRQPMEFVKMLYRGDRYKYYVHLAV